MGLIKDFEQPDGRVVSYWKIQTTLVNWNTGFISLQLAGYIDSEKRIEGKSPSSSKDCEIQAENIYALLDDKEHDTLAKLYLILKQRPEWVDATDDNDNYGRNM